MPGSVILKLPLQSSDFQVQVRCRCDSAIISHFSNETFPRIKELSLYLGNHEYDEMHQRQTGTCRPHATFWSSFFDGQAFPNLQSLQIRHFWKSEPQMDESLDLSDGCGYANPYVDFAENHTYGSPHRKRHHSGEPSIGFEGVEKLQTIVLEYVPELDAQVLMQLLGNPNMTAGNLTQLDLRFCDLPNSILAQLLFHAPPNLDRLTLLCRRSNQSSSQFYDYRDGLEKVHLCPLLREYAKKLTYLEYGASHICKHLFFDELEIEEIRKNGITTCVGGPVGELLTRGKLDLAAIQRAVERCRLQVKAATREARINTGLKEQKPRAEATAASESLFGGTSDFVSKEMIRCRIDSMIDEEEEKRRRLISNAKKPWCRRFMAWDGLVSLPSSNWVLYVSLTCPTQ